MIQFYNINLWVLLYSISTITNQANKSHTIQLLWHILRIESRVTGKKRIGGFFPRPIDDTSSDITADNKNSFSFIEFLVIINSSLNTNKMQIDENQFTFHSEVCSIWFLTQINNMNWNSSMILPKKFQTNLHKTLSLICHSDIYLELNSLQKKHWLAFKQSSRV